MYNANFRELSIKIIFQGKKNSFALRRYLSYKNNVIKFLKKKCMYLLKYVLYNSIFSLIDFCTFKYCIMLEKENRKPY